MTRTSIKRNVRLGIRLIKDLLTTDYFRFARKRETTSGFRKVYTLTQEIKPSPTFQNKLFNIEKAILEINQYILLPGEIFSFWQIIGDPENGYRKSRSIKGYTTKEENGGGLCQVSGMIYHLAISTGLEIKERYNHSIDLYTDETRFTPLGTDATVVYGYKDLKIRNNKQYPITFQLKTEPNHLTAALLATKKTEPKELHFEIHQTVTQTEVKVYDKDKNLINHSIYQLL